MPMPRQTPEQRRAALLKRQREIADDLKALDAKDREQARKDDTQRKIIAGALALEHLDKNPDSPFAKTLTGLLNEYAKPDKRHLFPFLPAEPLKAAE
ncbi:MAG: hypothetical protein JO004_10920 [Methylobacteriaceae bacterium]|nr:hypothetical protein [Methylobacteriaceae bacterium]